MKKKKTPYEALGVRPGDSRETVKRAYRRKAKALHPDCGGDPEEFKEVTWAYKLLCDDARRANYDASGDEGEAVDNSAAQAVGIAVHAFESTLDEALGGEDPIAGMFGVKGTNLRTKDLVKAAQERLRKCVDEGLKHQAAGVKRKADLEVLKRLESMERGEDYLRSVVEQKLRQAERAIAGADAEVVKIRAALELLKKFRYRMDDPSAYSGSYNKGEVSKLMWTFVGTNKK